MCALIALHLFLFVRPAESQSFDRTLVVDRSHSSASDQNSGTSDKPLLTIGAAVTLAVSHMKEGLSTRVVIGAGTYRESIEMNGYTHVSKNPNYKTKISFEARDNGKVVVSGSDVWTGWTADGDRFVHDWPYDWNDASAELHLRREIFFVDGELQRQVLSLSDLKEGTYFVDGSQDKVYLKPTNGQDISQAKVEVGMREVLWDQRSIYNTTVTGITFQHAATERKGGWWSAFRVVDSKNITVEKCNFRLNNGYGLFFGESENVLVKNTLMNNNGADGWNTWRVQGMTALDNETSYNNWRGDWGDWRRWDVGNKLESTHDLVIRRHKAIGNKSRGLWLDFDMENILLDQVEVRDNYSDGMWIEANQGPITVKNSVFCNNSRSGILTTYSEKITLDGNLFYKNANGTNVETNDSQLHFRGKKSREIYDFQTGKDIILRTQDWTVTNNIFVGGVFHAQYAKGPTLIDTSLDGADWDRIVASLKSDYNRFYHANRSEVFGFPKYNDLDLAQWRASTTQDRNSSFESIEPNIECKISSAKRKEEISLMGERPGRSEKVAREVGGSSSGAESVMIRFEIFDVNSLNEVEMKVNGLFVPLPRTVMSDGQWRRDSIAVDLGEIISGSNEIEFAVASREGSRSPGFKVKNISLSYSQMEPGSTIERGELPRTISVQGNYPNPFNPTTAIRFDLMENAFVSVSVYDMAGREMMAIEPRLVVAGFGRQVIVDAKDLPSGNYFYRVTAETGNGVVFDKGSMILLK